MDYALVCGQLMVMVDLKYTGTNRLGVGEGALFATHPSYPVSYGV